MGKTKKSKVTSISEIWDNLKNGDEVEMEARWTHTDHWFFTKGIVKVTGKGNNGFDKVFIPDNRLYQSKYILAHRINQIRITNDVYESVGPLSVTYPHTDEDLPF